jgi:hypothetical protein
MFAEAAAREEARQRAILEEQQRQQMLEMQRQEQLRQQAIWEVNVYGLSE